MPWIFELILPDIGKSGNVNRDLPLHALAIAPSYSAEVDDLDAAVPSAFVSSESSLSATPTKLCLSVTPTKLCLSVTPTKLLKRLRDAGFGAARARSLQLVAQSAKY
jgi:hypothetical protein